MVRSPKNDDATVKASGAEANSILQGSARNNRGLRVQISQAQPKGRDGPLTGTFVILNAGDNKHSSSLETLLHRLTDAGEVLCVIRAEAPECVSVVNTNILIVEPVEASPVPDTERWTCWREGEGVVSDPDFQIADQSTKMPRGEEQ